jgi:hypothetical protein
MLAIYVSCVKSAMVVTRDSARLSSGKTASRTERRTEPEQATESPLSTGLPTYHVQQWCTLARPFPLHSSACDDGCCCTGALLACSGAAHRGCSADCVPLLMPGGASGGGQASATEPVPAAGPVPAADSVPAPELCPLPTPQQQPSLSPALRSGCLLAQLGHTLKAT